jgi:serine/threonine-protein kinase
MSEIPSRLTTTLASRYTIERELGAGGMAVVYLAQDVRHDRQVAIKVMLPKLAATLGARRFLQEIQVAAKLQHPLIVALYDSGEADGFLYYVMPHVEGESLRARLRRESQLPIDDALQITRDVAKALDYAHEVGVIHRDIKPENILLSRGHALVADFGIAKAVSSAGGSALTSAGIAVGSPLYMSPEQAAGDANVDGRADIYSLGCVLYEMLAGEPLFTGPTVQAIMAKHAIEPRPSVRTIRASVPEHVDRALQRALDKTPADRFDTVRPFYEALSEPRPTTEAEPRPTAARRRLMLVAGVPVLAVVATLVLWAVRPSRAHFGSIGLGGRVSLVLSTDSLVFQPTLSPDGKLIAYGMGEAGGQVDLYVRRVAGGQVIRLTNDSVSERNPSFSPDGEFIAFTGDASVWIIPTLGGDAKPVVRKAEWPVWSPDGQRLAFVRSTTGGPDVLATVRRDGTDVREIFRSRSYFLRGLDWSPDGSEIALERSLGGVTGEIWRVSLDGTLSLVTRDPPGVNNRAPAYTPDGLGIVHSSRRGGATNLWVISTDGGDAVPLTSGSGPDDWPSVARDGTIAYLNARWQMELSVYDLQLETHRPLRRHATLLGTPAFSPDGAAVAFTQLEPDGAWHIWVVSLADGRARQLTEGSPPQIYPHFSADGQSVIYQSWTADSNRIWRVPLAGGPPVALTPAEENAALADVSPDGTRIAYVRSEGVEHIYIAPVEGGESQLLTDSPGTVPQWSPNGRLIAFSRDRGSEGGIFVIAPDGSVQLHVVPLEGGSSRHLSQFEFLPRPVPFDISPDQRLMAVVQGVHLTDEIWVIHPAR